MEPQVITIPDPITELRTVVKPFDITVTHNNEKFNITVPKDFKYDGASIPKLLWPFFGAPYSCKNDTPGCVHDYLYRKESDNKIMDVDKQELTTLDKYTADNIFYNLLINNGVNYPKANLMYYAVNTFGRLFYKVK